MFTIKDRDYIWPGLMSEASEKIFIDTAIEQGFHVGAFEIYNSVILMAYKEKPVFKGASSDVTKKFLRFLG